jgi:hypothetical protein
MTWTSNKEERAALFNAMMNATEEIDIDALLHCAAAFFDSDTILKILNRGADIMKEDLHHRLPLEKAITNNNSKFLILIQVILFQTTNIYPFVQYNFSVFIIWHKIKAANFFFFRAFYPNKHVVVFGFGIFLF